MSEKNLQDIMQSDIFAAGASGGKGDTVETLKVMEDHMIPLTPRQIAGCAYLRYLDLRTKGNVLKQFADAVEGNARLLAGPDDYIRVIDSITWGNRVKGTIRANKMFLPDNKG